MQTLVVPGPLRTKLGEPASEGLTEMFTLYHQLASERFERHLIQEIGGLRLEMHQGFAAIRQEMAASHIMWLRWSFLFWIGQVAAMIGILAYMNGPR